jgi:hypothetical protein
VQLSGLQGGLHAFLKYLQASCNIAEVERKLEAMT